MVVDVQDRAAGFRGRTGGLPYERGADALPPLLEVDARSIAADDECILGFR